MKRTRLWLILTCLRPPRSAWQQLLDAKSSQLRLHAWRRRESCAKRFSSAYFFAAAVDMTA